MIIFEHKVPKDNADDFLLVRKIYFQSGSKVNADSEVIDLETSKTAIILNADYDGYIEYLCEEGDKVLVNAPVFRIHDTADSIGQSVSDSSHSIDSNKSNLFRLSRAAKKYINDQGIITDSLNLSGFVSLKAIKGLVGEDLTSSDSMHVEDKSHDSVDVDMNLSKTNEIKALTPVNSAGLVSTIAAKIKVSSSASYFRDGILREVLFESSRLLIKYPLLNAYYNSGKIFLHTQINIGFAVDIDDGLKVLVIRDAESIDYNDISSNIDNLIGKYLSKSLSVADLSESTFTITDLSSFGVSSFSPLVNAKQSAMLGISSVDSLDSLSETIEISLSFDHRVTEGRYAANFLYELRERLEALMSKSAKSNAQCYKCLKTLSEDSTMHGLGFYRIIRHDGTDALVCGTCATGWS